MTNSFQLTDSDGIELELCELSASQPAFFSGTAFTMRDAGHKRALQYLQENGELPFELEGQALFYAGPCEGLTESREGRPFAAIGPTTAARMDFAAPTLYEAGITCTIGKGHRSAAVQQSIKDNGAVHLSAIGGAAAYLATFVISAELIAWEDLGPEALYKLEIENMPCFVEYV